MLPTQAFAVWGEELRLFVDERLTRDDNIFRLSKDSDAAASIGSPSRGDTYNTTSLGFNLDLPASRQRLKAAYTWSDTRYDRFSDLDFTGHDVQATWLWQLGNDASGQLGHTETSTQASFANIQSRTPDILKTRQGFFNAVYLMTPRWRIQAGARGLEQTNSDPARRVNDVTILSTDLAAGYVTPAGNWVGLGARAEEGRFPERQVVAGSALDNEYRQYGVDVLAEWAITGVSRVGARASRVSRRYGELSQRNFDGNTVRVEYDWKPTGKVSVAGIVLRDISPYEDIRTSFVLARGITLRPTLRVTDKIDLSGAFEYSVRDYLGDPGLALGVTQDRTDRVRSAAATVSYRPARAIGLQLSALRETRTSNVALADYEVNVFSMTGRVTF